jgi:hypothetical protein
MTPVAVRDLATGEQTSRPDDSLTVDVPRDFPRAGGVFTVADGFRGSYKAVDGTQVARNVVTSPLGWRAKGETFLIARTGGVRRLRQYRLCWIVPEEKPALRDPLGPGGGPWPS